jgi:ribA/ribD-fused uncharacterized protein
MKQKKAFQFHSKSALKREGPFAPGDARTLSNFSPHRVVWDGDEWPTAEHAFQAAKGKYSKGDTADFREELLTSCTPQEAKKAGGRAGMKKRGLSLDVAAWDVAKDECMYAILKAKAEQNAEVRQVLAKSVGSDYELVHFARTDMYWGAHVDKEGKVVGENVLGKLWTRIANDL